LGQSLGLEAVAPGILRQAEQWERLHDSAEVIPVARVIAHARNVDDCHLAIDAGATSIAKARTRHCHAFLQSQADVWVTCDEDVSCTAATLAAMLESAREAGTGVTVAPCFLRFGRQVNVILRKPLAVHQLIGGARLLECVAGGFGLVAVTRQCVERLVRSHRNLQFVDQDGQMKTALFWEPHPTILDGWVGEDMAFCRRAGAIGCTVRALGTGETTHAGQSLDLGTFEHERRLG
jgi:hypothetical protein